MLLLFLLSSHSMYPSLYNPIDCSPPATIQRERTWSVEQVNWKPGRKFQRRKGSYGEDYSRLDFFPLFHRLHSWKFAGDAFIQNSGRHVMQQPYQDVGGDVDPSRWAGDQLGDSNQRLMMTGRCHLKAVRATPPDFSRDLGGGGRLRCNLQTP